MTSQEWIDQNCKKNYSDRIKDVDNFCHFINDASIISVKGIIANDEQHLLSFYEKCLDDGFEGVMVKDLSSKYIFKRSNSLLKLKPTTTHEGVIVGCYEGRHNTRLEGTFGGFNVLLTNGVITRVGSGFSDKQRAEVTLNPNSWIGKIIECACQPPLTEDGAMRFPVFIRERSRSDVDKSLIETYEKYINKT
jgi:hypothetical protein